MLALWANSQIISKPGACSVKLQTALLYQLKPMLLLVETCVAGETLASRVPASFMIMAGGRGERGGGGGGVGVVMTDEEYVDAVLGVCRRQQQQQQQRDVIRRNLSGPSRFAPAFAGYNQR
jgi:hypothetical protein